MINIFLFILFVFNPLVSMDNPIKDSKDEIDIDNILNLWIDYDNAVNAVEAGKLREAWRLGNNIINYQAKDSEHTMHANILRVTGNLFFNKKLQPLVFKVEGKKLTINFMDYAQKFLKKAVDEYNDPLSIYNLAFCEITKKNYPKSINYLIKYIQHNEAKEPYKSTACYVLGNNYYQGQGVVKDFSKAVEYLKQVKKEDNDYQAKTAAPALPVITVNKNKKELKNKNIEQGEFDLKKEIFYQFGRIKNDIGCLAEAALNGHHIACKEYVENTNLDKEEFILEKCNLIDIVLKRFVPKKEFPEQWKFLEPILISYSDQGYLGFINLYVLHYFSYDSIFPENSFPSLIVDYLDEFYYKQKPLKEFGAAKERLLMGELNGEIKNFMTSIEEIIRKKHSPGFKLFYIRFMSALMEGLMLNEQEDLINLCSIHYEFALNQFDSIYNKEYSSLNNYAATIYSNSSHFFRKQKEFNKAIVYAKKGMDLNPTDYAQFCYAINGISANSQNKEKKRLSEMFEILNSLIDKGYAPAGDYLLSALIEASELRDAKKLYYEKVLPKLSDEEKRNFQEYRKLFNKFND